MRRTIVPSLIAFVLVGTISIALAQQTKKRSTILPRILTFEQHGGQLKVDRKATVDLPRGGISLKKEKAARIYFQLPSSSVDTLISLLDSLDLESLDSLRTVNKGRDTFRYTLKVSEEGADHEVTWWDGSDVPKELRTLAQRLNRLIASPK
ncbi:MAG: hypothetical protein V1495_09370 [Pseudomonadota bacterium]